MTKKKVTGRTGTADNAVMLLKYFVTPEEIYYTRDALNPSVQKITISAVNPSAQEVTVSAIQVKLMVSGNDPQLKITDDPSTIVPQSLKPDEWTFDKTGDGIYKALPLIGGTVPPKGTLTFILEGIVVNESPGTTPVVIIEKNSSGFPEETFSVVKIKSTLEIDRMEAVPPVVAPGASTLISWATTAAARVTLLPGNPPDLPTTGSYEVAINETTVFTLTAYGEGPNISAQKTVSVAEVKIKSFTVSPEIANAGEDVTLSWEAENATFCAINPGPSNLPVKSTLVVNPSVTTTYVLTAYSLSGKTQNDAKTAHINNVSIGYFNASPDYGVELYKPVTLTWNVISSTGVSVTPGKDNAEATGSLIVFPPARTTYTLVAQGQGGPVTKTITLLPMAPGWQMPTTAGPNLLAGKPVLLKKDNRLWFMANGRSSLVFYSEDGGAWYPSGELVPWAQRENAGGAVLGTKMWIMGGTDANTGGLLDDIWSSENGKDWTQVNAGERWSARKDFGCIAFNDKLWVFGGMDIYNNALNDVWSSPNGIDWTQEPVPAWKKRYAFGTTVYNNSIYMICGLVQDTNGVAGTVTKEIWYSADGKTWSIENIPYELQARSFPNVCKIGDKLYVAGGISAAGEAISDANYMTAAKKWILIKGIVQSPPPKKSGAVEFQNALWITGGAVGNGSANRTVLYYFPGSN